jgi:hypothetical protein
VVNTSMKTPWKLAAVSVLACVSTSCASQPPGEQYVRQKISIEVQSGKPITVEIRVSGNGPNDIGIRCSPEVWNTLTNGTKVIAVRLKSSDKEGVKIGGIDPGSGGTAFLGYMPNVHYLFYIHGSHTKASVEITFPNAPSGVTPAEIIVCKTPVDSGL